MSMKHCPFINECYYHLILQHLKILEVIIEKKNPTNKQTIKCVFWHIFFLSEKMASHVCTCVLCVSVSRYLSTTRMSGRYWIRKESSGPGTPYFPNPQIREPSSLSFISICNQRFLDFSDQHRHKKKISNPRGSFLSAAGTFATRKTLQKQPP